MNQWIHLFTFFKLLVFYTLYCKVSVAQSSSGIRYNQSPTIPFEWYDLEWDSGTIKDSVSEEGIQQFKSPDGIPLFYSQEIATSVCFDNQCRPLFITVYWNITGRYLGFYLPEKEFLSRYDHEPFSDSDYKKLNDLLADPYLPIRDVSFESLIDQSTKRNEGIDGVSGATSTSLVPYVIKGAAYTTYALWNIIYGNARDHVQDMTEGQMTSELLAMILRSSSSEDRIWGLKKIDDTEELEPRVIKALLEVIAGEDFFDAFIAIKQISPIHLASESLQIQLFNIYQKINYNLRKLILEKLKEAPMISREVIAKSREILEDLNGEQLGLMLELYDQHTVFDDLTCNSVAVLLANENHFIAQKAYDFLIGIKDKNKELERELEKYEQSGNR